jgi:hypothetical protein
MNASERLLCFHHKIIATLVGIVPVHLDAGVRLSSWIVGEPCRSFRSLATPKDSESWDKVREWLIVMVYPFADGAADQVGGGSDSRYGCNGDYCRSPKYSDPSRSMEITIVNNLGYDVTYVDHVIAVLAVDAFLVKPNKMELCGHPSSLPSPVKPSKRERVACGKWKAAV